MKSLHVIVHGSLAHDRILNFPGKFSDHIISDKIHELSVSFTITTVKESFGGTAGNISYTLHLLQTAVTIAANLGNSDATYEERLRELGLWGLGIQRVKNENTAAAYIMTDRVDNQITGFYPGALTQPYRPKLNGLLKTGGVNYLVLAPAPVPTTIRLAEEARRAGVPYMFDPGQETTSYTRATMRRILTGADVCIANDYEWSLIEKISGWKINTIGEKVHIIIKTLGPKGSTVWHHHQQYDIPPVIPRVAIDPTGAGDAYRAGFVTGYLYGLSLPIAGRLASLTATYAVETAGTQNHVFRLKELKKRFYQNFKKQLSL